MNIVSVEFTTFRHVAFVQTDESECNRYTRYGRTDWTVQRGESDEPVYDCSEIEQKYQEWLKSNPGSNVCRAKALRSKNDPTKWGLAEYEREQGVSYWAFGQHHQPTLMPNHFTMESVEKNYNLIPGQLDSFELVTIEWKVVE